MMSKFSGKDFIKTSKTGIDWYVEESEPGVWNIGAEGDATPILEQNKALQNAGEKWYSADKEFCRVATIPPIVEVKWTHEYQLAERGLTIFSEEFRPTLMRLLNSIDYRYLRTNEMSL